MTNEELTKEFVALKRRLEMAETKLSQQAGAFEFITGQLRDVQLYVHARFDDMDARFNRIDVRLDRIETDIGTMQTDVSTMKTDIKSLDAKFSGLDAKLIGLDAKFDALPRIIAEMIAKRP
jgi:chromosome segregation ATPase